MKNPKLMLKIVAYALIFAGCFSLIGTIVGCFFDSFFINFTDVIGIFAGLGLLKFSNGWRIYTLIYLWIMAIASFILTILINFVRLSPEWHPFKVYIIIILIVITILLSLGVLILRNKHVKNLFHKCEK